MTLAALIQEMIDLGLMMNGLGEYERTDAPGWYASTFRRMDSSTARFWQGYGKTPEDALRAALDAFKASRGGQRAHRSKALEDLL